MALIPQDIIDEVIERNEISSVVGDYVQLERKGSQNLFGLCPFHNEDTPSFSVNTQKQFYYCFGCHAGGNVVKFIEDIEHLTFPEAIEFLAKRVGMDIQYEQNPQSQKKHARKKIMQAYLLDAARFFYLSYKSPQGATAQAYMSKRRKLSPEILTSFGIGYADDSWDSLSKHLLAKGYDESILLELGLARRSSKGSVYDFFRNRVIFPVFDHLGRMIAFGGRDLGESEAKYINSQDSQVYNKGKHLYALNFARKQIEDSLILCEGYMDTITMHEYGFKNAVAGLGTALTPAQAHLIAQYASKVILAYDGDRAGQNATSKALELLEREKLSCTVLILPEDLDPDDYLHKYGAERFAALLEQSLPTLNYHLYRAKQEQTSPQGSLNLLAYQEEATAILAKETNAVVRELYAGKLARTIGVSPASILQEIERKQGGQSTRSETTVAPLKQSKLTNEKIDTSCIIYISALLDDNSILRNQACRAEVEDFPRGLEAFATQILGLAKEEKLNESVLLGLDFFRDKSWDNFKAQILHRISITERKDLREPMEYAADALRQMRIQRMEEERKALLKAIEVAPETEKITLLALLKEKNEVLNKLRTEVTK